jgi:hypothetical protein
MKKRAAGYQLPVPSTELVSDVKFEHVGGTAALLFEFDAKGRRTHSRLEFYDVRAYRYRAELHCTAWQIEGAYDSLVEVGNSDWAQQLRDGTPTESQDQWQLRHYLIYFDSAGCYEILASGWGQVD